MRLLFIADGRSPIALNWIQYFLDLGEEVHLVSSFPCDPDPRFASYNFIPVAFSSMKSGGKSEGLAQKAAWLHGTVALRTRLRQLLGPFTLGSAANRLKPLIEEIHPDLIHAMRIPYEGMLAAQAIGLPGESSDTRRSQRIPLLISIWGNDFTLHAPATPWMRKQTRFSLSQASAIHADCHRDIRLAREWGFEKSKDTIVLPGAGGIQEEIFYPPAEPVTQPVVINPRGFRSYVNNHAFFRSLPEVLKRFPQARFLCTMMAGEAEAFRWVKELGIEKNVELLPRKTRSEMADLFRQSKVVVSPSNHDGTPNTLLEAMACGCLPVAGDLELLREWITPNENGLLFNPNDPASIANSIIYALDNTELQKNAGKINSSLIAERAEYRSVMEQASAFYQMLISRKY